MDNKIEPLVPIEFPNGMTVTLGEDDELIVTSNRNSASTLLVKPSSSNSISIVSIRGRDFPAKLPR